MIKVAHRAPNSTRLNDTWSTMNKTQLDIQKEEQRDSFSPSSFSNHTPTTPSPSNPVLSYSQSHIQSRDSITSNSTTTSAVLNTPIDTSYQILPAYTDHSNRFYYRDLPLQDIDSKMTSTLATQSMIPSNDVHSNDNTQYIYTFHQGPQGQLAQSHELSVEYIHNDHEQQVNQFVPAQHQGILYGQQHLDISGWAPMSSSSTITHVNPQLMEPSPSRSLSPESNASHSPNVQAYDEIVIAPQITVLSTQPDEWYDGPSEWIRSVAQSHRQRRATYLANPKAWPKGEGEPKELQPLTDHCRYPHLWEVEQARTGLTEDAVVAKLMKKSQATIAKEFARCQKANEEFKPPRPMNSAMAFADFRRPQWGDMYSDMKTGSISTWLSAEWRALKDYRPEEFEWWTRVAKKYWDKYVEDYDYKFTRAPNGEGKGSKKRKAKAKETAAREKAIRMSQEAARRGSSRNGSRRSTKSDSMSTPMSIMMPNHQPFESPNVLGLTGVSHLTPTTLTPGSLPYNATGYFDGYSFPLTEDSRTPSPPQLLTPLEPSHLSHGQLHPHSPLPYQQQNYFYPTEAQMHFAHHQAAQQQQQHHHQQHQQQQQQHQQQQQQLHIAFCPNAGYYQPPLINPHEIFAPNQNHNQNHHIGLTHHVPTLAPYNIPSPQ
ncbi:uncharacterized protein IL334_005253 [Kwoniella shivajii]|uniref:HMG box domain-containing protein n=1 Tax=Kwoniella shivajii TaxID=564305 RepID=A0ABZ1D6J8_9TREE|nr:hypothetical protein IL334_005253 [Kwoniella shivajii]